MKIKPITTDEQIGRLLHTLITNPELIKFRCHCGKWHFTYEIGLKH